MLEPLEGIEGGMRTKKLTRIEDALASEGKKGIKVLQTAASGGRMRTMDT